MQGRDEGARVQAAQDQAELVEADRPKARRRNPIAADEGGKQSLSVVEMNGYYCGVQLSE
jgi:hypothetical protein